MKGHRERLEIASIDDDAYRPEAKFPEPTRCPDCGAAYRKGRWTWEKARAESHLHRCPACQRIRDRFPAGYVTLRGKFEPAQRLELVNLIRRREQRAKREHPLKRVIAIEHITAGLLVTTTDTHLAHVIGNSLRDAFGGTVEFSFSPHENLLRVIWKT